MGIHDGHRQRLKARFLEHGLENFNEVNALELLLFYTVPRSDTNPIAHALLDRFGSLSKIFDASMSELCDVPGVGPNTASLIRLIPQIMKKCEIGRVRETIKIKSHVDAGRYLMPQFMNDCDEVLKLLCLDSHKRIICCEDVATGVVNDVEVNTRRIVELALRNKASYVIISHNHPDGVLMISREDDYATTDVVKALKTVGIPVIDHIIVSGRRYVSFSAIGGASIFPGRY